MNFTQLFKNSGEKFPDEHFVPIKRNISIANVKYDEWKSKQSYQVRAQNIDRIFHRKFA